jgi:predicted TIM-barrel fold metal-dependent hydrolase
MQEQHLDAYHVEYGILTGEGYSMQTTMRFDYAAAICSAVNDYTIEHWLSKDSRFRGSVFIPKQEPHLSAQEIDRVGGRDDMVQVIVCNGAFLPYGNRYYYPIYEACVRHNLPFTIHVGLEGAGINPAPTGAGHIAHYVESRAARPQIMMAHLASLIFEGVFEKFPTLKVVLQESGVFWIVPYLWRLDQDWKALRVQTPWVRKRPSEYFRENIRMTTQPIEETPDREAFDKMLDYMYAKETLMFCSDYPHWDFDSPLHSFPKLDDELWDRIFYRNAAELYNLPARRVEKQEGLA